MLFMYLFRNYHQNLLTVSRHPIRQVTRFKKPPDLIIFPFHRGTYNRSPGKGRKDDKRNVIKDAEGMWQKDKVLKEEIAQISES